MKGIFVSFEGIEGTGKSTQSRLLAEYLEDKGFAVTRTAEPGGTAISLRIRELLLDLESRDMDPVTELLLYNASRVQHIREVIMPALVRGNIVITDRFSDSTVAYQGFGRGLDLGLIDSLDRIAVNSLRPDITILLDIDVVTGLKRNREIQKIDRLEREDISFHERVRQGFLSIAAKEKARIKLIPCTGDIETVQNKIIDVIDGFLEGRGKWA